MRHLFRNGIACHDDGMQQLGDPGPPRRSTIRPRSAKSLKAIFQFRVGRHQAGVERQHSHTDLGNDRRHLCAIRCRSRFPCSTTETSCAYFRIVGRGSVQSVADILFLQGVDLGIVAIRHARLSREEGLRERHQEAVHLRDQALQ